MIAELQAKKAELEKLIREYELMLPHLSKAREALDEAGITADAGAAQPQPAQAPAAQPAAEPAEEAAPAAEAPSPEPEAETETAAENQAEAPPAEGGEQGEEAPTRRSIASLVAEEEGSGDEATH